MKSFKELELSLKSDRRPRMKYTWGEALWRTVYTAILSESCDEQLLLRHLASFLPCTACKTHYSKYLQGHPLPQSKGDVFHWCVELEKQITPGGRTNRYEDVIQNPLAIRALPQKKVVKKVVKKAAKKQAVKKAAKKQAAKQNKKRKRKRRRRGCKACGQR